MSQSDPIVIVEYARTPIGAFMGALSGKSATELGAIAIRKTLARAGIQPGDVNEVLMGCVLPAGLGQAPARQASLGAGLPLTTGATTVNKVCGSGMKSAMLGCDIIRAGSADVVVAGGMESMSKAPYLLAKARAGYRLGHSAVIDHMFHDGLEDAYEPGRLMGTFAEDCAEEFQFSREAQDEFAVSSIAKARKAASDGAFAREIAPVTVESKKSESVISDDEEPSKADLAKIPTLRPAFKSGGTVTAANSSSISDGAAAMMIMRLSEAERRGIQPRARIVGHATHSDLPARFTTAPIGAMTLLAEKVGWTFSDIDLFEINEAFAVVPMVAIKSLNLPHEKVNVHGGACALGHPIGASGARIIVTLLAALERYQLKKGMASVCLGGGEATAICLERYS